MTRALITGATSGLGLEFAWQLAGSGHELVLVARNEERLAAIAAQIGAVSGAKVSILQADIAMEHQLEKVARRLIDPVEPINLLVHNGGHSLRTPFLDTEIKDYEEQLAINVKATMALSHAAATAMVKKGHGAILNVSSMAAINTTSVNAASKSWVTIFTEALAEELEGTGVTATVLLPGFVHTESHEAAAVNVEGVPRVTWLKAPFVVEQALKDCAAGNVVSVPYLAHQPKVFGAATPGFVRKAFQSRRVSEALAKVHTARAMKAAARHRSRGTWKSGE